MLDCTIVIHCHCLGPLVDSQWPSNWDPWAIPTALSPPLMSLPERRKPWRSWSSATWQKSRRSTRSSRVLAPPWQVTVDQGLTHTKTKTYWKPTKSMAIQSRVLVSFSNKIRNRKSTLQAGAIWRLWAEMCLLNGCTNSNTPESLGALPAAHSLPRFHLRRCCSLKRKSTLQWVLFTQ